MTVQETIAALSRVLTLLLGSGARGQDGLEGDGRWHLEVVPYLWLAGIGSQDRERTWVDPFVGLRGAVEVVPRVAVYGQGDIGGFGISSEHSSDFAWLAEVGASLRLSDRFSWFLGHRWFDTDYESGSFVYDMNLNGPITALVLRF